MEDGITSVRQRKVHKKTFFQRFFYKGGIFDYTTLILVLFLVCFGLIMVYSASSFKGSQLDPPDSAYWLKRQAVFAIAGVVVMLVLSKVDYHALRPIALLCFFAMHGLVLYVDIFGEEVGGAKRWFYIGSLGIQPSEVAKFFMILSVAFFVDKIYRRNYRRPVMFFIKSIGFAVPMIAVVGVENASTAIIMMMIVAIMAFVVNPSWKPILYAILALGAIGLILIIVEPYRMKRVTDWFTSIQGGEAGYQTQQGLYAIGSGGIFGKGLGKSMQKLGFVPEPHNDMIFSIVCEELGLFGAICIIILFLMLIIRIYRIAISAKDLSGGLITVGVMAHVAVQVLVNIAVVTNTMPNTGVPLPFISSGGTSLLFLLGEIGLVLSVGRQMKQQEG